MSHWILFILLVLKCLETNSEDICSYCVGEEYECKNGKCDCSSGYVPDYRHRNCIKCPVYQHPRHKKIFTPQTLGEKCYGSCCSTLNNETLECWHGVCHLCYSSHGSWICSDSMDQLFLVSGSQIVMAVALVLGIIATFTLLYKLCAVSQLSPLGQSNEGRLSVGSLQIYVDERLRDAPPRYSRTAPSGSSIYPASIYLNAGFIHDNSVPPPPYTPEQKTGSEPVTAIHI